MTPPSRLLLAVALLAALALPAARAAANCSELPGCTACQETAATAAGHSPLGFFVGHLGHAGLRDYSAPLNSSRPAGAPAIRPSEQHHAQGNGTTHPAAGAHRGLLGFGVGTLGHAGLRNYSARLNFTAHPQLLSRPAGALANRPSEHHAHGNATGRRAAGVRRMLLGGPHGGPSGGARPQVSATAAPPRPFDAPEYRTVLACTACAAPAYTLPVNGTHCECAPGYGIPHPNNATAGDAPLPALHVCTRCPPGTVSGPDAAVPTANLAGTKFTQLLRGGSHDSHGGGHGHGHCVACPAGKAPNAAQTACV
ncbi:hypothetical protein Rsub_08409 [Raphidocelis subcapitata]|uniref:Tyrosine-protein kinase ephrin type A/B receptor-like domain-containing protein n=1 Tax=Raphidocelis subcapitata TaxID=307507 RepID=A0A2V0PE52_9CHLO|nr:hypothetical protein Rsub_08409 [Raphidocelis subcapitata]|eukprot:GBF95447.1 hypothetical protein Rsub_08409 [Raphidocelis subcapitata]